MRYSVCLVLSSLIFVTCALLSHSCALPLCSRFADAMTTRRRAVHIQRHMCVRAIVVHAHCCHCISRTAYRALACARTRAHALRTLTPHALRTRAHAHALRTRAHAHVLRTCTPHALRTRTHAHVLRTRTPHALRIHTHAHVLRTPPHALVACARASLIRITDA